MLARDVRTVAYGLGFSEYGHQVQWCLHMSLVQEAAYLQVHTHAGVIDLALNRSDQCSQYLLS